MLNHQGIKTLQSLRGLHFLPLGGCGEIGMNANFYCFQGQWIMIDSGVTFSKEPDTVVVADIREFMSIIGPKALQGLIITHGHEDHIGGIGWLFPYLNCPIYATPFTAFLIRSKLKEMRLEKVSLKEVALESTFQVGNFQVELISFTHSIPESNGVVLRTTEGIVLHTGDWKIDPVPLIGQAINAKKMEKLGQEGILALVCDSTNVFDKGTSISEKTVKDTLERVIMNCKGRVIVSCFSSNVARVQSCYEGAQKAGRKICLIGRSLKKILEAAQYAGYFKKDIAFVKPEDLRDYPPSQILILTTGSQAEVAAPLSKMSFHKHPFLTLTSEDTVILSSKAIPGNQGLIAAMKSRLALLNVTVISAHEEENIHASGHPCRDELAQMYAWLKPKILVPIHGEDTHILEHTRLGQQHGIGQTIRPHNGTLIHLASDGPKKVLSCL